MAVNHQVLGSIPRVGAKNMNTKFKWIFNKKAFRAWYNNEYLVKTYSDHRFYDEEVFMPTLIPYLFWYYV
jgi:hypothetical protein